MRNNLLAHKFRGGSRSSGNGVHMYKGMRVRFADFISFSLPVPSFYQIISFSCGT